MGDLLELKAIERARRKLEEDIRKMVLEEGGEDKFSISRLAQAVGAAWALAEMFADEEGENLYQTAARRLAEVLIRR